MLLLLNADKVLMALSLTSGFSALLAQAVNNYSSVLLCIFHIFDVQDALIVKLSVKCSVRQKSVSIAGMHALQTYSFLKASSGTDYNCHNYPVLASYKFPPNVAFYQYSINSELCEQAWWQLQ